MQLSGQKFRSEVAGAVGTVLPLVGVGIDDTILAGSGMQHIGIECCLWGVDAVKWTEIQTAVTRVVCPVPYGRTARNVAFSDTSVLPVRLGALQQMGRASCRERV